MIHLRSVYAQINPSCFQMDFDTEFLGTELSECPDNSPTFGIRSYNDVSFEPKGNFQYHLTNLGSDVSCFQTNEVYNITRSTEIYTQFFWESTDSNNLFQIWILDEDTGDIRLFLDDGGIESKWFTLIERNSYVIPNGKVIREDHKK